MKRFYDEKGCGFIEYKENGDVLICYSINEYEYVELVKTETGYEIKNKVSTIEV